MDIVYRMQELAAELTTWSTSLMVDYSPMPSGLTYLHVNHGRRCFVMAYYPKEPGIGVDEVLPDEGFEMGYKHWFTEFEPAKDKFLSLLNEAIDSAPGAG